MVQINSLPYETLSRIFYWVLNAQSLNFENLVDEDSLLLNSLAMSQTHIDLSIRGKVVSLGRIFASRAGDLPLSIRVVEAAETWWAPDANFTSELDGFISDFGPSTYSLEIISQPLLFAHTTVWFKALLPILNCASGKLTRLLLWTRNNPNEDSYSSMHGYMCPQDSVLSREKIGHDGHGTALSIPETRFEAVLSNVQILELDVIYPLWESKAYHGLTELRITGPRKITAIWTIQQLAHILTASPALRVFHFGLEVRLMGVTPKPIRLVDLEVFFLKSLSFDTQQAVLALILPGTKRLQMSTTYNDVVIKWFPVLSKEEELSRFFNRTNIVYLQLHSLVCAKPQLLLSLLPNLQSLIFRQATIMEATEDSLGSSVCPGLVELHLISCTIHLDGFLWLISGRHMREVTIWDSHIYDAMTNHPAEHYSDALIQTCPIVRLLSKQEYSRTIKVEGWSEDMKDRISES